MSKIEWTEQTWNPTTGCSRKSSGCENCYAEVMTARLEKMGTPQYQGLLNEHGRFNGTLRFAESSLLKPLKRKKPITYFVNSMSDLFHENVPDEWIDQVFAVMSLAPQHIFQILTKRPERMRDYLSDSMPVLIRISEHMGRLTNQFEHLTQFAARMTWNFPDGFPFPNVWLGVSVEDQKTARERIRLLLDTPAAVRFVSAEPLLNAIDFQFDACDVESDHLDWVIVGGESGSNARYCNINWIRSIVKQCRRADVPVFVKQLGRRPMLSSYPFENRRLRLKNKKGGDINEFPQDLRVREYPVS